MMTDIKSLKKLAEASPAGPWVSENDSLYFKDDDYTRHLLDADSGSDVEESGYYTALKFIAAANPAAVLELIAEIERGQRRLLSACVGLGLIGDALGADMDDDTDALLGMVNDLKAENISLRCEVERCTATLPDVTYMDPPDGGSPTVAEQLSRMAKDAARYRWTSIEGNWVARFFGKWRAHVGEYGDASPTKWYETREEAIDAAMAHEANQSLNPA